MCSQINTENPLFDIVYHKKKVYTFFINITNTRLSMQRAKKCLQKGFVKGLELMAG